MKTIVQKCDRCGQTKSRDMEFGDTEQMSVMAQRQVPFKMGNKDSGMPKDLCEDCKQGYDRLYHDEFEAITRSLGQRFWDRWWAGGNVVQMLMTVTWETGEPLIHNFKASTGD